MPLERDLLDTPAAGPTAIRGGAVRVLGYVAGTLLSVVSAAALLRYLGVEDFGRYATVLALVTIVSAVTEAGMTSIGVREWSVRPSAEREAMLRSLLGLRLLLTAAGVVCAVAFALLAGYPDTLVWGTALWGAGVVVHMAALTLGVPLQSALRLGWVSALDLVRQAATVVLLLALIAAGASLLALLAVPLPAALLTLAATLRLVRGGVSLRPAFDRERWRELLRETLPFALAIAVGAVYVYVSQILMSLISSEEATGIFSASFRIFIVIVAVPGLLVGSALPILARAARDDEQRLRYATGRIYDVCLVLGAWTGLVVVAAAPALIEVVAGDGFEASVNVLRIHGLALLFSFLAAIGGFVLLSLRRYRDVLAVNAAGLATSVALTLWLGSSIGAEGAATANVAGELVLVLGYGVALMRAGMSFGLAPAARVAASLAIAAAVLPLLPAVPAALAGTLVFFGGLALLGGIPPEARELARRGRAPT